MSSVIQFANDVLDMQQRLREQEEELWHLREVEKKYRELLGSSLAHSEHMVGQTLRLLMTPGVVEACQQVKEA